MLGVKTLHEELTELLMNNGASVSKLSIDKLIEFIAVRDEQILNAVIRDTEQRLVHLQQQTKLRED